MGLWRAALLFRRVEEFAAYSAQARFLRFAGAEFRLR
jgi:hypothetical protein